MCFLVINVLNDCHICMCLIVCMYAGISRRNSFKGGEGGGGGGGGGSVKLKKNLNVNFSENGKMEIYRNSPEGNLEFF